MFKEVKDKEVKIYEVAEDFYVLLMREDCGDSYNWFITMKKDLMKII